MSCGDRETTAKAPADPRIEGAIRDVLGAVGEDPEREGLRSTPARVARSMAFLTSGYAVDVEALVGEAIQSSHQSHRGHLPLGQILPADGCLLQVRYRARGEALWALHPLMARFLPCYLETDHPRHMWSCQRAAMSHAHPHYAILRKQAVHHSQAD